MAWYRVCVAAAGKVALVVCVFLGARSSLWAQEAKDRFDVGEEVPMFTLKAANADAAGGQAYVSLDRYCGEDAEEPKKAVLLSFFATYCEPCKREMPYLAALQNTYGKAGLQVLSVTIDRESEKVAVAKDLAAASNATFPVLSDRFNIVAKRYFISKLPCLYVLNGEGKVVFGNVGYNDDLAQKILAGVRQAVGEPIDAPVPDALRPYVGAVIAAASAGGEGQIGDEKQKSEKQKKKKSRNKKRRRQKSQR